MVGGGGRIRIAIDPRRDAHRSAERRLGQVSPGLATSYVRLLREGLLRRAGEVVSPREAESDAPRNELGPILHAEVDRLPKKYCTLVVHCYLEGKTNEEVAQLLGCPVGTVKGRLWRTGNGDGLETGRTGNGTQLVIDSSCVPVFTPFPVSTPRVAKYDATTILLIMRVPPRLQQCTRIRFGPSSKTGNR